MIQIDPFVLFQYQMRPLTLYILYMCRINIFLAKCAVYFFPCLLGTWKSHKMLVKSAIRLPNQFLTNNIVCHGRNQLKMAYFIKLVILIFGCPEQTHITNFTRMPLQQTIMILANTSNCLFCLKTFRSLVLITSFQSI